MPTIKAILALPKKKVTDENCYTSSDYGSEADSTDSEIAEYDEWYPEMQFKIIKIKSNDVTETAKMNQKASNCLLRFECRSGKPGFQVLLDMMSKKQPPV